MRLLLLVTTLMDPVIPYHTPQLRFVCPRIR